MKKYIRQATNTSGIPSKPILGAEDEEVTLDDVLRDVKDEFDYILSGIEQLPEDQGFEFADALHLSNQDFINQIASSIQDNIEEL